MIPTIGQKLKLIPSIETDKHGFGTSTKARAFPCTVIGIHRKHGFFRVRFDMPHGSFTESYKFI